ncbi:tetratricopeptide repeat protein [Leptospira sp. 96542]|nr:tetratricopeptide repeat protein [Leptospira sp. 96542]
MIRILFYFLFISVSLAAQSSQDRITFAFRSQASLDPLRMIIVGDVVGIEKASFFEVDKLSQELEVDTRPDTVTLKVSNPKGIRVGQTLYLLEKDPDHKTFRDGNIVGMVTVKSVYQTTFFGWQVRGEGYLRLIEDRPVTAARLLDTTKYEEAFFAKKKGDHFFAKGLTDEALRMYKHAISLDPGSPDFHYALGKAHWKDGEGYVSTAFEYSLAWKNKERFSNSQEKLLFLVDYMRFLIYYFKIEGKDNKKHLEKLPLVAKEARTLYPKNYEVWLYSFESAYTNLIHSNLEENSVDLRKRREELSESSEMFLNKALSLRRSDYYLHKLACEFYNLKWKEYRGTQKEKEYRDKLIDHGKQLRLYYTGESNLSEDLLNAIRLAEKQSNSF